MPLTFIDIERQKSWRIWVFFLILMILYFVVCLAFALPLLPHAVFITSAGSDRSWPIALFLAFFLAGIHLLLASYNAVNSVIQKLEAQPPDSRDDIHKMLLNIIAEIHVVTGNRKKIQCFVVPSLSLNALAASDLKGRAAICITEGLLSRLNRSQLETVIAHEAHHILSGDCLETTIAASLFGSLSSLIEKYSDTTRGKSVLHPAFLPAWVLLQLSYILNMFISRQREYRADAAAVRMTRNPIALAEALYLLSRSWRGSGFIGMGFEMMCIVNLETTALNETEGLWADLFSTHPPVQKRIDLLLNMAHMSIRELIPKTQQAARGRTVQPQLPAYYAMSPQQQWQGPFTLPELAALPWLSPLTWVTTGEQRTVDRAWKDPLISGIFSARLEKGEVKKSDFTCPSCRQQLIAEHYEGTQIYRCRFCAGTLTENAKISRILARTGRERPCTARVNALGRAVVKENQLKSARQKLTSHRDQKFAPHRLCAKCSNPMSRGFFTAAYLIEVDRCSSCNLIWFDQDELEMLQCLIENRIVPEADKGISDVFIGHSASECKTRLIEGG